MRLAAALLVCLCSILIGFSQAARLKKRKSALEEFLSVLLEIKGLLQYERASTEVIYSRIEQMYLMHLGAFFAKRNALSKRLAPSAALTAAMPELPEFLLKKDRELFIKLGEFLGRSDAQTQIEQCEQLREKCSALLDEYKKDKGNLAGLYQKLGVLFGIAAAILIL